MRVTARHAAHGAEDRSSHGQIETSALLLHVGRSEIHGHGTRRVMESRIVEGRADPLAALLYGSIGHANRDEVTLGARRVHVHLDINQMSVDAVHSGAAGAKEGQVISRRPGANFSLRKREGGGRG